MVQALEQRLEEMQRRHEEEMAVVRVECLAQMAKGKALKTGEGTS